MAGLLWREPNVSSFVERDQCVTEQGIQDISEVQ